LGSKSVVEWPDYTAPRWLEGPFTPGSIVADEIPCRPFDARLSVLLWSSALDDPNQPRPLLIVHDGAEYAEYSRLVALLDHATATGTLPPMRAALVAPVDRDNLYWASAHYARWFARRFLPWLGEHVPTAPGRAMRVGMGASLGALAMLHIHRTHPGTLGALFLQSGSYFRRRFAEGFEGPIPVTMTCGIAEESDRNNRAVRDALARQGYGVGLASLRDAHNWIAWRDAFDPHLVGLLRSVWAGCEPRPRGAR
jgi:enterochelin esterase family protein